jgi:hypothetical protein
MRSRSVAGAIMLCLAGAEPAGAQAIVEAWRPEPLRMEMSAMATLDTHVLMLNESEPRWSPGWARLMLGSAAVTPIWEKPNRGLAAGAALGALPLLLATGIEGDDAAGGMLLVAWIGAPLAAAAGQRLWSHRPGR